jgi:hypothetical protein
MKSGAVRLMLPVCIIGGQAMESRASAIDLNRRGDLSDAQRTAYVNAHDSFVEFALYTAVFVFIAGFAGLLRAGLLDNERTIGLYTVGLIGLTGVAAVAAGIIGNRLLRARAARLAAQPTPVVQREGRVEFGRKGYVARAQGRRLKSVHQKVLNLKPGRYTFYCVRGSRYFVNAEPLDSENVQHVELLLALQQANRFSALALARNREGRLTARQAFRLLSEVLIDMIGALIGVGLIVFSIILIVFNQHEGAAFEPLSLAPAAVGVLFVGVALLRASRSIGDALVGRVMVQQGKVIKAQEANSEGDPSHFYVLDEQRFAVSERAYKALVSGAQYHVYYTPRSKRLVNIEPLS